MIYCTILQGDLKGKKATSALSYLPIQSFLLLELQLSCSIPNICNSSPFEKLLTANIMSSPVIWQHDLDNINFIFSLIPEMEPFLLDPRIDFSFLTPNFLQDSTSSSVRSLYLIPKCFNNLMSLLSSNKLHPNQYGHYLFSSLWIATSGSSHRCRV